MANATILYACTGSGLVIANKPGTLDEWLPSRTVLEGRRVLAAWAEPGPPIRVLAAVSKEDADEPGGLMLSENGGRVWSSVFDAEVTCLYEAPRNHAQIFAGLAVGGLAESVDGGATWGVLPGPGAGVPRAISAASAPDELYLMLEPPGEPAVLLRGSPAEGAWQTLSISGLVAFAVDAETGDIYGLTADGLNMSADAGATWASLPNSPPGARAIAVIPGVRGSEPTLLVGAPTGLYSSSLGGVEWALAGLHEGDISTFARDPERRDRVYAATSSGYIYESGNRGQTWKDVTHAPVGAVTSLFVARI